jgi:hypothetical protein
MKKIIRFTLCVLLQLSFIPFAVLILVHGLLDWFVDGLEDLLDVWDSAKHRVCPDNEGGSTAFFLIGLALLYLVQRLL